MSFDQIIAFHIYIYIYIYIFSQGVHINIYNRVRSRPRVSVSPTWRRKVETVQPGNSLASDQYPRDEKRHPKYALSNVERNKGFNSISYASFLLSLASNLI